MIKIDKTLKKLYFQNDYQIGKEAIKTYECDLLSGYICPKCEQILLAYFKTDEFIPVWRYDKKEKNNDHGLYDTESDRRYYRYRVFYAGCGILGMELKEHNEHNGCLYEIHQNYNLISSVNKIFREIEDNLNNVVKNKRVRITPLPEDFDKEKLVRNLKIIKGTTLIPDVCTLMDPLIKFSIDSVKYNGIDIYDFDHDSPERKKAELQNFENMRKAYGQLIKNIKNKKDAIQC